MAKKKDGDRGRQPNFLEKSIGERECGEPSIGAKNTSRINFHITHVAFCVYATLQSIDRYPSVQLRGFVPHYNTIALDGDNFQKVEHSREGSCKKNTVLLMIERKGEVPIIGKTIICTKPAQRFSVKERLIRRRRKRLGAITSFDIDLTTDVGAVVK